MKTTLIAAVTAAVVAGLVGFAVAAPQAAPQADVTVGAQSGPDSTNPYFSVNGVRVWAFHPSFRAGTTSVINFRTPPATSTLMAASGCNITLASTSAKTIRVSKSARPNASTTVLYALSSAASGAATAVATTTTDAFTFGPNQYLGLDMFGGAGTDSPAGSCSFFFLQQ